MSYFWTIVGIACLLIGAAVFLPSNTLTGNVITEGTCHGIGCVELCEMDAPNTCGEGLQCCQTHWQSGVCDYDVNCERIREYSLYQSLETYQDSVREQPAPVHADMRSFIFPLIIVLAIIGYFMLQR